MHKQRQISVKLDAGEVPNAKRAEAVLVLEPAEGALEPVAPAP
jgi:hypothetical protein